MGKKKTGKTGGMGFKLDLSGFTPKDVLEGIATVFDATERDPESVKAIEQGKTDRTAIRQGARVATSETRAKGEANTLGTVFNAYSLIHGSASEAGSPGSSPGRGIFYQSHPTQP